MERHRPERPLVNFEDFPIWLAAAQRVKQNPHVHAFLEGVHQRYPDQLIRIDNVGDTKLCAYTALDPMFVVMHLDEHEGMFGMDLSLVILMETAAGSMLVGPGSTKNCINWKQGRLLQLRHAGVGIVTHTMPEQGGDMVAYLNLGGEQEGYCL
ncbi:hypothetical protein D3C71_76950 [compost metagenome]